MASRNEKVSIVTPFYNSEKYLSETIESVIEQKYPNWELLLVDDGSQDSSAQIVSNYARGDKRIKYFSVGDGENRGKTFARNLGLKMSDGEFVTFLDSDDLLTDDKLEKKIRIFTQYSNVDMVLGNTVYWNSWRNCEKGESDHYPCHGFEANKAYGKTKLLSSMIYARGAIPCICSFIIKKKVLKDFGYFDQRFKNLYEDQVLIVKALANSVVYVLDSYHEFYRQRDDSDWHLSIMNGEDEKVAFKYLIWLEEYIGSIGFNDPSAARTLRVRKYRALIALIKTYFRKPYCG